METIYKWGNITFGVTRDNEDGQPWLSTTPLDLPDHIQTAVTWWSEGKFGDLPLDECLAKLFGEAPKVTCTVQYAKNPNPSGFGDYDDGDWYDYWWDCGREDYYEDHWYVK